MRIPNGTYRSTCLYEANGNLYYKVSLDINDDAYKVRYTLHNSSACAGIHWYYDSYYNVEKSIYDGDSNEDVLLDLSVTSIKYLFNHSWYISQHYCGITNWVINTEKDLTGLACQKNAKVAGCSHAALIDSLTDRDDKMIRPAGAKVYLKVRYDQATGVVDFPANDDAKGDDSQDRFGSLPNETKMYELNKI